MTKVDQASAIQDQGPEIVRSSQMPNGLTPQDEQALSARWIPLDLAVSAGIRRVDSYEGAELIGRKDGASGRYAGLVIPNVFPGDSGPRRLRLRRDRPDLVEASDGTCKPDGKYLSPSGEPSRLYFAPGIALELLTNTEIPVVITEGEFKGLALSVLANYESDRPRFLPIAVEGVWNFRGVIGKRTDENGQRVDVKGIRPDFDRVKWNGRDVVILFDADGEANESVQNSARSLSRELRARGSRVRITFVPDPANKGIDDYLGAYGPEQALKIIDEAPVSEFAGFELRDDGVYFAEPEKPAIRICSPLFIKARTSDTNSSNHGRLLEWMDRNGYRHRWAMPMELLAGDAIEIRAHLLANGLHISTGKRAHDLLNKYIQEFPVNKLLFCLQKLGWHDGIFVLPDVSYGGGRQMLFQPRSYDSQQPYRTCGSLDGWREEVALRCIGNSRPILVVSLAFVGPLLEIIKAESGGIHLFGTSSSGKTTLLIICGSVLGIDSVRRWRATANGLEAISELHNDGTLILDELSQLDPREAAEIAYHLMNGSSKVRMTNKVTVRPSSQWRISLLSSGELTLAQHSAQVGRQIRAGAEVRLLNVPANAGASFGVFEFLHGAESPAAFRNELVEAAAKHSGVAFREFIARLVDRRSDVAQQWPAFRDVFRSKHVPEDASPEVGRAAERFALIGFAGELATEYGITGWPPGTAMDGATRCFQDWLNARGGTISSDVEAAVQRLLQVIERDGASRFQRVADRENHVPNRAGFYRDAEFGIREFLLFPRLFRGPEICGNTDYRSVAEVLEKRGILRRQPPNWTISTSIAALNGEKKRAMICIRLPADASESSQSENNSGISGHSGNGSDI
jgi:putative DNA primase/helicase